MSVSEIVFFARVNVSPTGKPNRWKAEGRMSEFSSEIDLPEPC